MADNVTVTNQKTSFEADSNPDLAVRTSELSTGKHIQHFRLDVGSGASESAVSGSVPISAASLPLPSGAATESTLSSLNGKVTAVDTGAVVVSSSALPSGAATAANQTTGNSSLSSIDSKITACNTGSISGTVTANAGTNLNTSALALESGGNLAALAAKDFATQTTLSALNAKVTAVNTGAVVVSSSALPSGAATAANQLPDGHNVTVDNGAGASAVNVQDGGNSLTVDGTVAATQSGTWNITNISGTVSLPTGAATQATLATLATESTLDNIRDTVIATGSSSQNVQGAVAAGAAVSGCKPVPIAFQDFPFGNAIVPTGLNASGIYVLGTIPLDLSLNLQDFSAAGEVYSLAAATANSSATARYITVDSSGAVLLQSLPAGSNTIGAVTLATPPQTTGWLREYNASYSSTGTVNASARKIGGWAFGNSNATASAFIRIYDKSTAATSSDTPIIKIGLAPGASANIELVHGIPITNGFSVRATTGVADSNVTSPTANNVFGTVLYV